MGPFQNNFNQVQRKRRKPKFFTSFEEMFLRSVLLSFDFNCHCYYYRLQNHEMNAQCTCKKSHSFTVSAITKVLAQLQETINFVLYSCKNKYFCQKSCVLLSNKRHKNAAEWKVLTFDVFTLQQTQQQCLAIALFTIWQTLDIIN